MDHLDALLKALAKKGCKTAEDIDINTYVELIKAYFKDDTQAKEIRKDVFKLCNELKKNPDHLEKHLRHLTKDISEIINKKLLGLCKRVRA